MCCERIADMSFKPSVPRLIGVSLTRRHAEFDGLLRLATCEVEAGVRGVWAAAMVRPLLQLWGLVLTTCGAFNVLAAARLCVGAPSAPCPYSAQVAAAVPHIVLELILMSTCTALPHKPFDLPLFLAPFFSPLRVFSHAPTHTHNQRDGGAFTHPHSSYVAPLSSSHLSLCGPPPWRTSASC